jgi:hypothetical protein
LLHTISLEGISNDFSFRFIFFQGEISKSDINHSYNQDQNKMIHRYGAIEKDLTSLDYIALLTVKGI